MKKVFWLGSMALMMSIPFAISVRAADDEPQGNAPLVEEKALPDRMPEYWLGIELRPDEKGIMVQQVVPDSPAAKAGIAPNDVIQKADDKKISEMSDVIKVVEAAKDKEMKLEILRDGKPMTIAVTPAKRPEEARFLPRGSDFEAFRRWIEQLPQGGGGGFGQGPLQFRFMRPGVILPHGAPIHPPLPGNMSITITKTGDKPAEIVVKEGDEKWEVTEKDLDKLPERVRPFVERMLGTAAGGGAMFWVPEVAPFSPPEPGSPGNVPPGNNMERRIERRLEDMRQRIDRLENELHMLHPGAKPPEQPPPAPEKNKEEPQGKSAL